MRTALVVLLSCSISGWAIAERSAPPIAGRWVMHLFVGDKLFDDRVTLDWKAHRLEGSLTVPDRFTAKLENISQTGDAFAFEIEANEGRGKFRVRYEGRFVEGHDTFIGSARVTAPERGFLGGFVGQRRPD